MPFHLGEKKGDTDVGIHINNSRLYHSFTSVFAQQRWRARSFFYNLVSWLYRKAPGTLPMQPFQRGRGIQHGQVDFVTLIFHFKCLQLCYFQMHQTFKGGKKSYLVYLCSEGPFWHFCHIFDFLFFIFFAAHIKLWMHLKMCSFPDSFNPVR